MAIFGNDRDAEDTYPQQKEETNPVQYGLDRAASDKLWSEVDEARDRIAKRHSRLQAETIALNKEYDRLCEKVRESIEELENFEKEKFRMTDES